MARQASTISPSPATTDCPSGPHRACFVVAACAVPLLAGALVVSLLSEPRTAVLHAVTLTTHVHSVSTVPRQVLWQYPRDPTPGAAALGQAAPPLAAAKVSLAEPPHSFALAMVGSLGLLLLGVVMVFLWSCPGHKGTEEITLLQGMLHWEYEEEDDEEEMEEEEERYDFMPQKNGSKKSREVWHRLRFWKDHRWSVPYEQENQVVMTPAGGKQLWSDEAEWMWWDDMSVW